MAVRKGQVFSLAAILFSGLVVLAMLPNGPTIDNSANNIESFKQIEEQKIENFNAGLDQNRSVKTVRNQIYGFNRFNDIRSARQTSNYHTVDVAILPKKGKALIANYQNSDLNASLRIDGTWHNQTIEAFQYNITSFSPGRKEIAINLENLDEQAQFNASTPRLYYWLRIESDGDAWENSYVG